jgi:hypothetical protein
VNAEVGLGEHLRIEHLQQGTGRIAMTSGIFRLMPSKELRDSVVAVWKKTVIPIGGVRLCEWNRKEENESRSARSGLSSSGHSHFNNISGYLISAW